MFYDSNDVQLSSMTDEVTSEDTAMKYEAWGWKVITIDGHDHDQIRKALNDANAETKKPTLIIGKTIMGKGCVLADGSMYEGECELHGKPIGDTKADFTKTLINLGAESESNFDIYEEVQAHYATVLAQKTETAAKKKATVAAWKACQSSFGPKNGFFLSGVLPDLDLSQVVRKSQRCHRRSFFGSIGIFGRKPGKRNRFFCGFIQQ